MPLRAVRTSAIAAFLYLWAPHALDAQVLTIGETLGKGKAALLLTDNVIVPGDGIPNLNVAYAELARGLTDRFDLYLTINETTTNGTTQGTVRLSGNTNGFSDNNFNGGLTLQTGRLQVGADTATLDTYAVVYQIPADGDAPLRTLGMRYVDDMVRKDGTWCIHHRVARMLWMR